MRLRRSQLDVRDHDRDVAGMRYVYPVLSRRAGGVSIGVNLNPNHACNWHCAYCQVPGLVRGRAPAIDLALLRAELAAMFESIARGDFLSRHVPPGMRRVCDVAISGNGEPTSCADFEAVVATVLDVLRASELAVPLRLITNGSYMGKAYVQRALKRMAGAGGEVWIKVDAGDPDAIRRINGVRLSPRQVQGWVETCARLCPSWIQTCMMRWDGQPPQASEVAAYLELLQRLVRTRVPLRGVLLYAVARPPRQPEGEHVGQLDESWLRALAARIERVGLPARVFAGGK